MGVIERDPYTGHGTTGHEWNGIKELNTRVPWLVWACLVGAVAFSVAWWILLPAWPLGTTYTKGLLGWDARTEVVAELHDAKKERGVWMDRIAKQDYAAIQADPALMKDVRETGHTLFGDNCAACHGIGAKGGPGFPDLAERAWLWGGTPEALFQTIRVGVNSEHKDSRTSEMPAWGRQAMLPREQVVEVANYVYSLTHEAAAVPKATLDAGAKVFAETCAACHGANAKGNQQLGAPDLTDPHYLYGRDLQSIYRTVFDGRKGHMPTWESRISEVDRKILTLYVLDLRNRAKGGK